MERQKGDGVLIFVSSFIPPCNACLLVAKLSQLDTHLTVSDVGKQRWSDKDLRFGCEQTTTSTERGVLRFESIAFLLFDG